MKKILFAFMVGLIPALALTNEAYAQPSGNLASTNLVKNYFKSGATETSKNPNTANLAVVNAKALKSFEKQYKVTGEKWEVGTDCFTASYVLDNINHLIYFDKKGNWIASLKIYNEHIMPKDIRKMVRQEYYDYKIGEVREIEILANRGTPVYLVSVEDDNNLIYIKIQDYNMSVYKEFKKP